MQLFDLSQAELAQLFQALDAGTGERSPGWLRQFGGQVAFWLTLSMSLHSSSLALIVSLLDFCQVDLLHCKHGLHRLGGFLSIRA